MARQKNTPIPHSRVPVRLATPPSAAKHGLRKFLAGVVLVAVIILVVVYGLNHSGHTVTENSSHSSRGTTSTPKTNNSTQPAAAPNPCAGNTLANFVLVSISEQHLWACSSSSELYDSAVVTGMELYPADLTPPGTYKIYAKETDQTLTGHDSTGSWSDPVSYWMPFLDNQYGQYGFHDATWRSPSDFGNININAPYTAAEHGSHGCVELPLATAKWLYDWAPIGTTVTIES